MLGSRYGEGAKGRFLGIQLCFEQDPDKTEGTIYISWHHVQIVHIIH